MGGGGREVLKLITGRDARPELKPPLPLNGPSHSKNRTL